MRPASGAGAPATISRWWWRATVWRRRRTPAPSASRGSETGGCPARSAWTAAQRRGRAAATLGEIRQRADCLVFWAVDPAARYPRYRSRYAVDPVGLQTPDGRRSRTVVAVDVGPARGPADADRRVTLAPADEVDALGVMRAAVQGRQGSDDPRFQPAVELA